MEEEGTVSLWLGTATSPKALEQALAVTFTEDGDFLGSPFSRAFGIEYYEDSTREADVRDTVATLRELLRGASYETKIVPAFEQLAETDIADDNAVVLLYDIRYDGAKARWSAGPVGLRFIGAVRYR